VIFDIAICILLAFGVFTGLCTIQTHHEYFSDFTVVDLLNGRLDGWLYILNLVSTSGCLVDLVLRVGYISDSGWSSTKWQLMWLVHHAIYALTASTIHCITNSLLKREGFCRLCKREWSRGDGT
jgi:hypothetical protein